MLNYSFRTGTCLQPCLHHLLQRSPPLQEMTDVSSIRSRGCRQREGQLKQEPLHHSVFFSAKPGRPEFNTPSGTCSITHSPGNATEYQMKTEVPFVLLTVVMICTSRYPTFPWQTSWFRWRRRRNLFDCHCRFVTANFLCMSFILLHIGNWRHTCWVLWYMCKCIKFTVCLYLQWWKIKLFSKCI